MRERLQGLVQRVDNIRFSGLDRNISQLLELSRAILDCDDKQRSEKLHVQANEIADKIEEEPAMRGHNRVGFRLEEFGRENPNSAQLALDFLADAIQRRIEVQKGHPLPRGLLRTRKFI